MRRALGYKLVRQGELLVDFVGYLQAAGAATSRSSTRWAGPPADRCCPVWWSARMGVVRGFARYLHALDPATEVPPVGCCPTATIERPHTSTPTTTSPRC